MTGIDTIVNEPAVQAIGWALVHFVWQGTLIAAIAAIALRCLRHSASDVRYVVATIALSLMATLPVVTGVQTWRSATAERVTGQPAVSLRVEDVVPAAALEPADPAPVRAIADPVRSAAPVLERWLPVMVVVWMAGVLVLAVRLAGGWIWVQRTKSRNAVPADAPLDAMLQRLTRSLHIRRRVRLLMSMHVDVPTVIGWLKPTVLLPMSAASGLSPVQLEAILAHELAHIRRHDYLVNLLQTLLETLLFYHPAVWWLSRRIRAEREHCCDDLAVTLCGDPVVYARALADMEELRGADVRFVLAASGGPLLHRIRRLLAGPATHDGRGPAWLAAAAAVVLMLGLVAGASAREPMDVVRQGSAIDVIDTLRLQIARTIHLLQNIDLLLQGPPPPRPLPPAPPAAPAPPVPPPAPVSYDGVSAPELPVSPVVPPAAVPVPSLPMAPAPAAAPMTPLPPPAFAPLPPSAPMSARPPVLPAAPRSPMPSPPAFPSPPAIPSAPAIPAPAGFSQDERGDSSGTFSWSSNGQRIEVKFRGRFELNGDDTDLARMSPNAYLRISDGRWLSGHSVEFQADASGAITRRFFAGSTERPFEPEGREWLKQNFPRFIRMSGFDAKGRVARILKSGGTDAVLKEIGLVEGSHSKKTYYSELLQQAPADAALARRVLTQAAGEIDSDYEMATLLITNRDRLLLDEASRRAYFDAARTIDSDYEMKRVFTTALNKGSIPPDLLASILTAARSIDSDYEAATVMIEVVRTFDLRGPVSAPFFALLETVSSSHEKGRVLLTLLRRGPLSDETLLSVLRAAETIDSHYETGQILQTVARTQPIAGPARELYVKVAESLGDHEQSQALAALVRSERR